MNKTKVKIHLLWMPEEFINYKYLINWKSNFFSIHKWKNIIEMWPPTWDDWQYTDEDLQNILDETNNKWFSIFITRVPLECNYYSRRLSNNNIVISIYEMYDILQDNTIQLEKFILRMIYEYYVEYRLDKWVIITSAEWDLTLVHHEILNCLFDFNAIKNNIIYSSTKPVLCEICRKKIKKINWKSSEESILSEEEINILNKELNKIDKELFFILLDFIRRKPKLSIFLWILFTIIINIISNFIYTLIS